MESLLSKVSRMTIVDPAFEQTDKDIIETSAVLFSHEVMTGEKPQIAISINPKTDLGLKNVMKYMEELGIKCNPYFLYNTSRFFGVIADISDIYNNNPKVVEDLFATIQERSINVDIRFHKLSTMERYIAH